MASELEKSDHKVDPKASQEDTVNNQNDQTSSEVQDKPLITFKQGSRKKNELPVDRGWAWLVCLSGFMTAFVTSASSQYQMVLFVEILERYETSYTKGSLIFMFCVLSTSLMVIVTANFLLLKVEERKLIFIAGLIFATSDFSFAFSPSIDIFIFLSALKGIAFGCILIAGVSLIRHYFHRHRSVAFTIAHSGGSVCDIIIGPIVMAIRHYYGFTGVFILIGALDLHLLIAAMLLRPLESYSSKPELPPLVRRNSMKKASLKENIEMDTRAPDDVEQKQLASNGHEKTPVTDDKEDETNTNNLDKEYEEASENLLGSTQPAAKVGEIANFGPNITKKKSLTVYISNEDLSVQPDTDDSDTNSGKCWCWKKFNKSIFGLWAFRMAIIATIPSATNSYLRTYIPTIARTQGASMDEAALLLTIIGVVDMIGRNVAGLIVDTGILKASQVVLILQISAGIVCQFLRFFTTFPTLIVMAIILGTCTGVRMSMTPLLSLETVGIEKMPQGMSFLTTIATFFSALLNPALGAVAEETQTFVVVMHITGVLLITGGCLLLPLPLMRRHDKRMGRLRP